MIAYLILAIGGLLALLGYQTTKRNAAEGQSNANKLSDILDKDDKDIAHYEGLDQAEEEKRKELANKKDSDEELITFLNDRNPK